MTISPPPSGNGTVSSPIADQPLFAPFFLSNLSNVTNHDLIRLASPRIESLLSRISLPHPCLISSYSFLHLGLTPNHQLSTFLQRYQVPNLKVCLSTTPHKWGPSPLNGDTDVFILLFHLSLSLSPSKQSPRPRKIRNGPR